MRANTWVNILIFLQKSSQDILYYLSNFVVSIVFLACTNHHSRRNKAVISPIDDTKKDNDAKKKGTILVKAQKRDGQSFQFVAQILETHIIMKLVLVFVIASVFGRRICLKCDKNWKNSSQLVETKKEKGQTST